MTTGALIVRLLMWSVLASISIAGLWLLWAIRRARATQAATAKEHADLTAAFLVDLRCGNATPDGLRTLLGVPLRPSTHAAIHSALAQFADEPLSVRITRCGRCGMIYASLDVCPVCGLEARHG